MKNDIQSYVTNKPILIHARQRLLRYILNSTLLKFNTHCLFVYALCKPLAQSNVDGSTHFYNFIELVESLFIKL